MPRTPQRSAPPRRRSAETRTPRETPQSPSTEPPAAVRGANRAEVAAPRFRIFIIDSGWNSVAHRVLQENFELIRDLQKEDPIYVLSREQSIEFIRHHQDRIGREPLIAVHDLAALSESGTTDFHGFRLHLGLMRTPQQALLALQNFARFISTHRQSADLEAEIRADLRREGLAGAIEIVLHHEAREIGE
jgi:hypothetical protein